MKPCGGWLGRLVVSGACLGLVGCGGSDVPDPDSDSAAVADQPAQVVDRNAGAPAPAAPAEAASADAPAALAPAAAEAAAAPAPAAPAAEATAVATSSTGPDAAMPAEGEAPAATPAVKADASATDELARLAAAPPAPVEPTPAAEGAASGAAGATGSGAPAAEARPGLGRGIGMEGSEGMASSAGIPAPGMPGPGGPGSPGGAVLGAPGMEGMPPGGGGEGVGANEPADFSRPSTAATAFLSALKAKDKDRLAQAVARRAPTEAVAKHQETFAAISEARIGDDELDALAKAMDGFKPVSQLQAESSGRMWIVIGRMDGNKYHQRKLTMRKEKEGWKLLDFTGVTEFNQSMSRRRR